MKTSETIQLLLAIISGICLASIQVRRIVKGEMEISGLKSFKAAAKIHLDKFDKIMCLISGISFLLLMITFILFY